MDGKGKQAVGRVEPMVFRVYVEKRPGFDVEARQLLAELRTVIPDGLPLAAGRPG